MKATVYHILTCVVVFVLHSVDKLTKIMISIILKSQTNYGFYELFLTFKIMNSGPHVRETRFDKNVHVYSLYPNTNVSAQNF